MNEYNPWDMDKKENSEKKEYMNSSNVHTNSYAQAKKANTKGIWSLAICVFFSLLLITGGAFIYMAGEEEEAISFTVSSSKFIEANNEDHYLKESGTSTCGATITVGQYELGDVNKDGFVTAADAASIGRYIAGFDNLDVEQKILANVNGDFVINEKDATEILSYVTKCIPCFSAEAVSASEIKDDNDSDSDSDNDKEENISFSCMAEFKNNKTTVTVLLDNAKNVEIESIEYINDGVLEYNTVDLEFSIASFPTDPSIKIKYNSSKELEIKCSKNNASPEYYESGLSALQNYSTNVRYYIYLPENIDKRDKVPLIVALHGGAGKTSSTGCGSFSNLSIKNMLKNGASYPAIILLPIRNEGCSWPKILTDLKGLINFIIEKYEIDENRISLLGHSQGGAGELALIIDNPDMFSAAFIMSPAANGGESDTILKVPTWFVTGEKDYKNIGKYVAAFKENLSKQTNFKDMYMFTELLGVGHNTDQTLFADKNVANGIINWLISQEKGKNVQFDESIVSNKITIKKILTLISETLNTSTSEVLSEQTSEQDNVDQEVKKNSDTSYKTIFIDGYQLGDVDKDGIISTSDAVLVKRYIVGYEKLNTIQIKLADTNGDALITDEDVNEILNYVNGKINYFTAEKVEEKEDTGNDKDDTNYKTIFIEGYRLGDVNKDGKISASDATAIKASLVSTDKQLDSLQKRIANVNEDAKVDNNDAQEILDYVTGKINYFTAEKIKEEDADNDKEFTPKPITTKGCNKITINGYKLGDVNKDGKISASDATAIKTSLVSTSKQLNSLQKRIANVNGDAKVDNNDAQEILDYVTGKITCFTAEMKTQTTTTSNSAAKATSMIKYIIDMLFN